MKRIIYCYDAYSPWCYAFSIVVHQLWAKHRTGYEFEVFSGGLIIPKSPVPLERFSAYYSEEIKLVQEKTNIVFGSDFLWHIQNPGLTDWFPDSTKPAIALSIIKDLRPDRQVEFSLDLCIALFKEGRDLCDDEAYRHLLKKYDLPAEEFYSNLKTVEFAEEAREDFAVVKQLAPGGYPSLLLESSENKFIQLTVGYETLEEIELKLKQ